MNRNSFEFGAELALGAPKVIDLLHPQPQSRPIAAEAAQPRGHRGRDRHLLGHYTVQSLARYAKLPRSFANRDTERRHDVLAKDGSWMGRLSLYTNFRCSLGDHNSLPNTLNGTAPNLPATSLP